VGWGDSSTKSRNIGVNMIKENSVTLANTTFRVMFGDTPGNKYLLFFEYKSNKSPMYYTITMINNIKTIEEATDISNHLLDSIEIRIH